MLRRRRRLAAFAAATLVTGLLVVPTTAQAQGATYNVQLAEPLAVGDNCDPGTGKGCTFGESQRFFGGGVLRVHPGDTIHFTSEGFHSATAIPKNNDAQRWIDTNAPPVGGPYSLVTFDPDDGAGALKANNAVVFPSSQECGSASTPCAYDGSTVVNSGLPLSGPLDLSMTVNAEAGDYFWVVCLVHMHTRMRVEVVAADQPASSQADIDTRKASAIALDEDWAAATAERLDNPTSHGAGGDKVWDSYVGYDNHWTSLFGMFPAKLNVKKGDTVRFHFEGMVYEDHTATFPQAEGLDVANTEFFAPQCDPDGDAGPGPDTPPDAPPEQGFCSGGPQQVEFEFSDRSIRETGDAELTSATDYESSGLRGANSLTAASRDVRFTKASKKAYKYICILHPFMRGSVKVK